MNTRRILLGAFAFCSLSLEHVVAQVPQIINYQGRIVVGTTNFNGAGQFKFALVNNNGSTTYWSNDGTSTNGSEPTNAVSLNVASGLYAVLLGDTSVANMTVAIPASVFNNSDVRLRVWFNDGTHGSQLLAPDQRVASVGYAAMAANVPDGSITDAKIVAVNGSKITGTLAGSALPANVATVDHSQTFTASITASSFSGDGSSLTSVNAAQLGGVAANQYVLGNDPRLSDTRPPTAGSANYIQNNPASAQSGSLNITGNATVGGTVAGTLKTNSFSTPPAATSSNMGMIGFNSGSNTLQYSDGTQWRTLSSRRLFRATGTGIDTTTTGALGSRNLSFSCSGYPCRITYTDNFGVRSTNGLSTAAEWQVTLDGTPTNIRCVIYAPAGPTSDYPAGLQSHTIVGYLTPPAGNHSLGVSVAPGPGFSNVVPLTGYPGDEAYLLELEEIVP